MRALPFVRECVQSLNSSSNLLLAAMPAAESAALIAQATRVPLPLRLTLQTPDCDIPYCYFVLSGMVLSDGEPLEIGMVGREGVVGLPAILGAGKSPSEALVQLPGMALRVDADVMKAAFDTSAEVRSVILRYVQAMQVQVAQTAACNGRHDTEQRLARWLLMASDKFGPQNPMPLTQEFLSMMLGVRRQQVSIAAAILQKAGLIQYRHGSIDITDRAGLQNAACECYGIVAREFDRLIDRPVSPGPTAD
jgi:CRP-like cAMP-binding protein